MVHDVGTPVRFMRALFDGKASASGCKPCKQDVNQKYRNWGSSSKTNIFFEKREQERTMIAWAFATMLDGSVLSGLD